jgi:hypothetical protein
LKRVTEYSGRVNFWLAGGFGVLYAIYTVAGTSWPGWLGRSIFRIFEQAGGIPVWATALVVLSAVPAAFQYGLWDSNAQDRCRRLELLLMTRLTGQDYWRAAALAAWRRGRGYFAVATLLWIAAALAGAVGITQSLASLAAGTVLWGLYFTVGFRAFSRGIEAGLAGLGLTVGLPLLTLVFHHFGWPDLAALLPPGSVYYAAHPLAGSTWSFGVIFGALLALFIGRQGLARCEVDLRLWYSQHHGRKVLD